MTHVFFDDSLHERGRFALGAFVFFDRDPTPRIDEAITSVGLIPGKDEYKSRNPHAEDERWRHLRSALFRIATGARIGLVVTPYSAVRRLGEQAVIGLAHIIASNDIAKPISVFVDQGIFLRGGDVVAARASALLATDVTLNVECDSRTVLGIQVADLVAHACAVTLLGRMGIADKVIRDDEEGGCHLSFEMWARLRYSFFAHNISDLKMQEAAAEGLLDSSGGLFIAADCDRDVAQAARDRFGYTWLGCIH